METTIVHASKALRELVIQHVPLIESGYITEALEAAAAFRAAGAVANCNLGMTHAPEGSDACVAWYAGQFLDIVDNKGWAAMNTWLNCFEKFCAVKRSAL